MAFGRSVFGFLSFDWVSALLSGHSSRLSWPFWLFESIDESAFLRFENLPIFWKNMNLWGLIDRVRAFKHPGDTSSNYTFHSQLLLGQSTEFQKNVHFSHCMNMMNYCRCFGVTRVTTGTLLHLDIGFSPSIRIWKCFHFEESSTAPTGAPSPKDTDVSKVFTVSTVYRRAHVCEFCLHVQTRAF